MGSNMTVKPASPSRRNFLGHLGQTSGYGAVYLAMQGLGLLATPLTYAGPPKLPLDTGKGKHVVILGAGIAGMVAALELSKVGFKCTILETRERAGGRNWTLRRGSKVAELGKPEQVCDFGDGQYFNAGPARIPSQHQALLGYCKEFGIKLEVFINDNRHALFQNDAVFGGKPIEARQLHYGITGHISELLAKAIDGNALDQQVDAKDKRRLLIFLRSHGHLDRTYEYKGSERIGYDVLPGAGERAGQIKDPLDPKYVLNSKFWYWQMYVKQEFDQQATMLQPVGGMDAIAKAFEAQISDMIAFNAEVRHLQKSETGARIIYHDKNADQLQQIDADYCLCTIPLSVLHDINAEFSEATKRAVKIGASRYWPTCKLAWQAKRRFWEEDSHIYGGISYTDREITQIWYPCNDYHGDEGILLGAYNTGSTAGSFGNLDPEERAVRAMESGERFHPGFGGEVGKPISVAWHRLAESRGGWASWRASDRPSAYKHLLSADGPFHFAGEHLSYLTGWQEGAILSAHDAVTALAKRAQAG